jgi:hypothetical protein
VALIGPSGRCFLILNPCLFLQKENSVQKSGRLTAFYIVRVLMLEVGKGGGRGFKVATNKKAEITQVQGRSRNTSLRSELDADKDYRIRQMRSSCH